MKTFLLPALVALAVCACATTPKPAFVAKERLAFDAAKYPNDAALVLHRSDKTELVENGSEASTRFLRHEVVAVLGEGGFDLAEVRVPLWAKAKLLHFTARVVQPDGTEQAFDGDAMFSDASGKGERDLNAKYFRFPRVQVGSVLEYVWQLEAPGYWNADEQDTLGVFPVQHYEFELTAPKPLVLETISFNNAAPIEVRTLGDGRHQLRFELQNIATRRDADYAPHFSFTEPRWAWRVLAYHDRAYHNDWLRNWEDVVEGKGRAFFVDKKHEKGLTVTVDVSGCTDVACKVQRAVTLLAEKTTTDGVKWGRVEPLGAAFSSGSMSVTERALFLRWFLAQQGLDAWLAYGTGRYSQQTSPTFPRFEQFDHLFVHLPAQPGVARPTTIDASCASCGFGQLPERYLRTPVFVFKTEPELSQVRTTGRWVNALEDDPPPSKRELTHRVVLDAEGSLADTYTYRTSGPLSDELRQRRAWKERKVKDAEYDAVRKRSPVANVDSVKWLDCSPASCALQDAISFAREATRDGAQWLVPMTFLSAAWDDVFESPTREQDVHFADPLLIEETADLAVPPGFQLVEVPAPVSAKVDGLSVDVRFERTATGARLKRTLRREVSVVSKGDYAQLRAVVETFQRGRRQVLVFAPKP